MDPLQPNLGEEVIVCTVRPRAVRISKADRRARRADIEIERLRAPCFCRRCKMKKRWPGHYMGLEGTEASAAPVSFECHIEEEGVDPDLAEELRLLRNEPVRFGAIWVGTQARRRS